MNSEHPSYGELKLDLIQTKQDLNRAKDALAGNNGLIPQLQIFYSVECFSNANFLISKPKSMLRPFVGIVSSRGYSNNVHNIGIG